MPSLLRRLASRLRTLVSRREPNVTAMPFRHDYLFRGANQDLFHARVAEVLISGAAGTGKSLSCLSKLHWLASHVPGLRALIVRKTRVSLTESALVTFERDVLPEGHPALTGPARANRHAYVYPNGSEIVVGGIDRPGRIMSTEYDLAYVQEAIELEEADWDAISSRLRYGRLPYQQLLADTNPDTPTHWLKARCDSGRCLLLPSRHEDNPRLWDGTGWTPEGLSYLARLDALTGARRDRLRHGRWVQAEGVVYEGWNQLVHLVNRFEPPPDWPRWLAVDFGMTAPFACLFGATDHDGRLYVWREVYRTRRLVQDHAGTIRGVLTEDKVRARHWGLQQDGTREEKANRAGQMERQVAPRAIVCDHDGEGRKTLEQLLGLTTIPANKKVPIIEGINAVAARLRPAADGRPRLFVMRDTLVERDPNLAEAHQPLCLAQEFDAYVWDRKRRDDYPADDCNHALDALRYLCVHLDVTPQARIAVYT